jgi:hypothetical protein
MRCPACGREMADECTHMRCTNILCDYEEEIENRKVERCKSARTFIRTYKLNNGMGDQTVREVIQ